MIQMTPLTSIRERGTGGTGGEGERYRGERGMKPSRRRVVGVNIL